MEYSCSYIVRKSREFGPTHLTDQGGTDGIKKRDENKVRGCIVLRADEDGLYRWNGIAFSCTDEYGIEEVAT